MPLDGERIKLGMFKLGLRSLSESWKWATWCLLARLKEEKSPIEVSFLTLAFLSMLEDLIAESNGTINSALREELALGRKSPIVDLRPLLGDGA